MKGRVRAGMRQSFRKKADSDFSLVMMWQSRVVMVFFLWFGGVGLSVARWIPPVDAGRPWKCIVSGKNRYMNMPRISRVVPPIAGILNDRG